MAGKDLFCDLDIAYLCDGALGCQLFYSSVQAMIPLGRYMFRADRLWAYLKYVIALANLITMIYVTGWPWWVWTIIIVVGPPMAIYVMWIDKTKIYPDYSDAAFEHLQKRVGK